MVPSPPARCQRIPRVLPPAGGGLLEVDGDPDDVVLDEGADPEQVGLAVQDVAPMAGRAHEGVLDAADRGGDPSEPIEPQPTFWPSQTQWSVDLEMSLCHRARASQRPP